MLNLCNDVSDISELFDRSKRLILYGAGASTRLILQAYYDKGLRDCLEFIVDINDNMDGQECIVEADSEIRVMIRSLKTFCNEYAGIAKDFILVITPYIALSIVPHLDLIMELEGVDTYIYSLIANKEKPGPFKLRNTKEALIPKKIHYFWLGGNPLSVDYKKNIESWKKYAPGYEIIEWNEDNYDIYAHHYTSEAMQHKQYMYITDYARKDILYKYGGIYLDVDVELLNPIDDLLYNEAFIGIDDGGQLNSGSGLGAIAYNPIIKELRDLYDDISFCNRDGSLNLKYNTYYESSYMIKKRFELKNKFQTFDGMNCFPREVFMPEGFIGLKDNYTKQTLANHKVNPYDKTSVKRILQRIKE